MANIIIQGKEYNGVPAVRLPAVGGGSATFYESGGGGVIAQPITITENGVYTAPEETAYTPVTVNVPSSTPTLQSKTVNPTTSQQTVSPDSGYDGLSSVTVNAMPSGSATTPSTSIIANPTISVDSSGLVTATTSASESITPTISAGYVSTGTSGTVSVSGSTTQQLSTQSATTITPSTVSQTAVTAGKYTTGAITVDPIPSQYIVPTGTVSIASNGTVDVTQYASADVNVSNWTLLGSKDFTINQTGESNTSIGSITIGASAWTKDNVIWVRVRDKAGTRNGYYYGSDTMFFNSNAVNGVASTYSVRSVNTIRYNSSQYTCYNGAYGVWAHSITTAGKVNIYARYNSTYTLTINGTFSVDVYSLSLPTGKTIF